MVVQMSARLGSLVALALGVGLEGAEVALPEPAVGSGVEVGIAVWISLWLRRPVVWVWVVGECWCGLVGWIV